MENKIRITSVASYEGLIARNWKMYWIIITYLFIYLSPLSSLYLADTWKLLKELILRYFGDPNTEKYEEFRHSTGKRTILRQHYIETRTIWRHVPTDEVPSLRSSGWQCTNYQSYSMDLPWRPQTGSRNHWPEDCWPADACRNIVLSQYSVLIHSKIRWTSKSTVILY